MDLPMLVQRISAPGLIRLTTATALAFGLLLAVVPPGAYFLVAKTRLNAVMEAEAAINARQTSYIVSQNPLHWTLQEAHLSELMSRRTEDKVPEIRRVVTQSGETVVESVDDIGRLRTTVSAPVHDSGAVVAHLEISRSLNEIVQNTVGISLICIWLAIWSYLILKRLPTRALMNALDQLSKSKDKAFAALRERDQAEESARTQAMFLTTMRHELRTPMNGVLGMLELSLGTDLTGEQREYLEMAQHSAREMMRVVNDVLDFSLVRDGQLVMHPTTFDLADCVTPAMEVCRHKALDKHLAFEFISAEDVPQTVTMDRVRLRQILDNLLDNAVKFTHAGKVSCRVGLDNAQPGEPHLLIEVSDTGIGIPSAKLDAIFAPFTQLDASITRNYGGTGLGLALCKALSALMRGEIRATSVLGQGSQFQLRLPVVVPAKG